MPVPSSSIPTLSALANASLAFSISDLGFVVPPLLRIRSRDTWLGFTHSSFVVTRASFTLDAGGGGSGACGSEVAWISEGDEMVFGFCSTERRRLPQRIQYFRVGWFALPHLGQVLIPFLSPSGESAKNTYIYAVKVF
jgi:hypothetical protein